MLCRHYYRAKVTVVTARVKLRGREHRIAKDLQTWRFQQVSIAGCHSKRSGDSRKARIAPKIPQNGKILRRQECSWEILAGRSCSKIRTGAYWLACYGRRYETDIVPV